MERVEKLARKIDLTGQRFGSLTVVERSEIKIDSKRTWLCKCDCGRFKNILTNGLRRGDYKSCGCLKNKRKDLVNKRVGKLTVIKPLDSKKYELSGNRSLDWLCKCDCGNEKILTSNEIQKKRTKSCGCWYELGKKEKTKVSHLNTKKPTNNTSGAKGVTWCKSRNKWRSQIGFQGNMIFLGRFNRIEDAIDARKEAEEKYFEPILEKYDKKSPLRE